MSAMSLKCGLRKAVFWLIPNANANLSEFRARNFICVHIQCCNFHFVLQQSAQNVIAIRIRRWSFCLCRVFVSR